MAAEVSCQEDLAHFRGPKGLPVVLVTHDEADARAAAGEVHRVGDP